MTQTWIASLTDPALKADFTSFANSGMVTEADLAKAFGDLVAENTKAGAKLSASQFADLQSIAANIGSMGASPYLEFITDAFVDGDAANAHWTGGGSKIEKLGDLAVGFTSKLLSELVRKWFDGTDLPLDYAPAALKQHFTYSAVNAPLFGPDGPQMSDINQGSLGDCYLLSSLAEVAKQNPSAITSMITDNGDGTYGVRFYVDGVARYVTVDNELVDGGTQFNQAKDGIWASLVETAFAELQAQGNITGNSKHEARNSFEAINNSTAEVALEAITDATQITDFDANKKTSLWNTYDYNQAGVETSHAYSLSSATVLSAIAADLLVGDDVDLSSADAAYAGGKETLVDGHVMSIYGYDASTGELEIRNPWGAAPGGGSAADRTYDTTFKIGLQALLADGDQITADNMGTATTVSDASVVAASALQTMAQITSFAVVDSVSNIDAGLAGLISDTKLSSVTAAGTTGADKLNLTGLNVAATIDMGGDSDKAKFTGHSLDLGGGYDLVRLGSGSATIDYSFSGGGVEYIANFSAAHDLLSLSLNGGSLEETSVNNGVWISASTDKANGVFLAGLTTANVSLGHGIAI